jgi:hypothetical protein
MTCPKTDSFLFQYFTGDPATRAKLLKEPHLSTCSDCSEKLSELLASESYLSTWENVSVPSWNSKKIFDNGNSGVPNFWFQWIPTAACFVMLCVFAFNLQITDYGTGLNISFGKKNLEMESFIRDVRRVQELQLVEFNAALAEVELIQTKNNARLLQTVLEQTQLYSAQNFDRVVRLFDAQRIQDLEDMRQEYQQLVDSDYKTLRSLQQLASFVSVSNGIIQ